jgi:hypothetical protein
VSASGREGRRRRELIALAALLLFFLAVAVFAPQQTFSNDWRASSVSVDPRGARIAYELAQRLGWRVRREFSDSLVPDDRTVSVVLSPALPFRAKEVHALLEGVRAGGALLYAMGDETLDDSLRLAPGEPGYEVRADTLQPLSRECHTPAPFSDRVITTFQGRNLYLLTVRDSGAASRMDTLLRVRPDDFGRDSTRAVLLPAAVGFPLGRGHVVVVADVDLFRNDNVRVCAWDAAVQIVRFFEYLRTGGARERTTLVFDEYHHGHGVRPGTTRAIARYLRSTNSGKALAHLGIAGLVLLLALGPRTLTPRDPERVERRSPLEHVDALARAYWQVNATRTATRRLLHGVQRRIEHRWGLTRRDLPEDQFLDWIGERLPHRADDIALVRRALGTSMQRKDFFRVGDALRRLEHDLLTFRS